MLCRGREKGPPAARLGIRLTRGDWAIAQGGNVAQQVTSTHVYTRRAAALRRTSGKRSPHQRAFSLVELIVTLSITVLLAGMLMPALSSVRENAHRVVCATNQRQIGQAITMYAGDHRERLPEARVLNEADANSPNLMIARHATLPGQTPYGINGERRLPPMPLAGEDWDGLGLLRKDHYCDTPQSFYCPSHKGKHTYEENAEAWNGQSSPRDLFTNYHYGGHRNWRTGERIRLTGGASIVLAVDGLRTRDDFSHRLGMNMLRGDGSVSWRDNVTIRDQLPLMVLEGTGVGRDHDDLIYDIFFGRH